MKASAAGGQMRLAMRAVLLGGLVAASAAGTTGCAIVYQLFRGDGPMVPAMHTGLVNRRVAVVALVNGGSLGSETVAEDLARAIAGHLRRKVENISVVRPEEVADWIDQNNWDEDDFVEVGRGVDAERVVAVEVNHFRLHDGPTLYRGQASLVVRVIDVESGGRIVFEHDMPEFSFPPHYGIPTTDRSEAAFRRVFVQQMAYDVAKLFFEHPLAEDFAVDAAGHARR